MGLLLQSTIKHSKGEREMEIELTKLKKARSLLERFERDNLSLIGLLNFSEALGILSDITTNSTYLSIYRERANNLVSTCKNDILAKVNTLLADPENYTYEELDYWKEAMQEIIDSDFGNDEFASKKEILNKYVRRAYFKNLSRQEQIDRLRAILDKLNEKELQTLMLSKVSSTS